MICSFRRYRKKSIIDIIPFVLLSVKKLFISFANFHFEMLLLCSRGE